MRLYARLAEYFPQSPLAAEAAYRSADIRWQLEAVDAASRPSAKMRDPALHHQIDEDYMRKVIKKYPGTRWADLAAYHLLDNKLTITEETGVVYSPFADRWSLSSDTDVNYMVIAEGAV